MRDRLVELRNLINNFDFIYYSMPSQITISDAEYDQLCAELRDLERETQCLKG